MCCVTLNPIASYAVNIYSYIVIISYKLYSAMLMEYIINHDHPASQLVFFYVIAMELVVITIATYTYPYVAT